MHSGAGKGKLKERMTWIEDVYLIGRIGRRSRRWNSRCSQKQEIRLSWNEILSVGDEFRVGPGAQFVKIQALALSLH